MATEIIMGRGDYKGLSKKIIKEDMEVKHQEDN